MEQILTMGGHQVLVVILLLLHTMHQTAALGVEAVYPGCKSSPDEPDMSYPDCNRTSFIEQISTGPSAFEDFIINSTRLTECFKTVNSKIVISSVYTGYIEFNGTSSDGARNGRYTCILKISGPRETFFAISNLEYEYGISKLWIEVSDPGKTYVFQVPPRAGSRLSTKSNVFKIKIRVKGDLGSVVFNISFQAVPICVKSLQVKCLSPTKGIIETPLWSRGKKYPNNINSCLALHVPENHVTMISLVRLDLELKTDGITCYDFLEIYNNENCTGRPQKRICQSQDLTPTAITDTQALSFRFYSDGDVKKSGFRLLFSFHRKSEEPRQLPDGTWNCSVPFYDSFQLHFACTSETYCSDKENKEVCPDNDICGPYSMELGGICYRVFKPLDQTTWNKASETCNEYGGDLAILNDVSEFMDMANYITEIWVEEDVFVGLKLAPLVGLPEIYQNAWLWTDSTLAVYLPLTFNNVAAPYCAALKGNNFTLVSCKRKQAAAFLCEINMTPAPRVNNTPISLVPPSSWDMDNMTTCRHNHTTHTFLACDVSTNCSVENHEEILMCSNKFSPPVPFFTCRNQVGRVPYTLVCDFRSDCCDDSDEDFCDFPACDSRREYQCADGKQCVPSKLVCDKRSDCVEGSDELICWDTLSPADLWVNTVKPPAIVDFTGDGNFNVTRLNSTICPQTHFQCPGGGYCLPVYVRCNGVNDCPGKEDEMDCDHYTCPGFYRCRKSRICLHRQHLCDGVFQCPQHDDEWMCGVKCPDECQCYGHAFICTGLFIASDYPELRYADVSNTGMKPEDFFNNTKLIHLSVKHCGISVLTELNFLNMQSLDLSFNNIEELPRNWFLHMKNLISLSLGYNMFLSLDSFLYSGLKFSNLINVNFSGIAITEPSEALLYALSNVEYLNLSNTGLTKLRQTGFQSLKRLRLLDVRGCPMETFYPGVFSGLKMLGTVYADNYKLCCLEDLPKGMDSEHCHAPSDEISSCDALLKTDVFRVFWALCAIFTLVGNVASFVHKVCVERTTEQRHKVFVTHLNVSDFLMGIYLAIIGITDRIYYGNYRWHDIAWRESVACKLAGFLSLVSSEVSAFLISLITLERVLVIGFPHKNLRFNRLSAHVASMAAWLIGLVLGLISLLPMTSHWNFYSQSGICAPLPITRKEYGGSDYAFGVMIIMNLILFLFVAVGQLLIYWSIWVNTVDSNENSRESRDTAFALRLSAVVMTDFLCWFPIGLLGIMARCDVPIPSEIIVAIAIFVLPLNSALNPFLYTLNIVMERRRSVHNARTSQHKRKQVSSLYTTRMFAAASKRKKKERDYNAEEAFQLFKQFWEDGLMTPEQIRQQVWEMYGQ